MKTAWLYVLLTRLHLKRSGSFTRSGSGGRRGKERAARNERSSDWRRGAAGSPDPNLVPCGGSPREGARSEERAEQRLAAGGRRLPRPEPRPVRGVAAGRSAQRGTSGAATGGGGPQAPPTR